MSSNEMPRLEFIALLDAVAEHAAQETHGMGNPIFRIMLAVSITGAIAITTAYVFAPETPVAITEVFGCMLAAIICTNLE